MLNPSQMLSPPIAKALTESKESFQRAFLESLMTVAGKTGLDKAAVGRKKDEKEKPKDGAKSGEEVKLSQSKADGSTKKNISLTPPPPRAADKALINANKSLTPPPISPHDPAVYGSNAAQAMQLNFMFNALNAAAAAKSPHFSYPDYAAKLQQTMLLETLRQNVESRALLAMHQQQLQQQQQQSHKNPSTSRSPSSSASSPSSKH